MDQNLQKNLKPKGCKMAETSQDHGCTEKIKQEKLTKPRQSYCLKAVAYDYRHVTTGDNDEGEDAQRSRHQENGSRFPRQREFSLEHKKKKKSVAFH